MKVEFKRKFENQVDRLLDEKQKRKMAGSQYSNNFIGEPKAISELLQDF